jgi:hypothetical protein
VLLIYVKLSQTSCDLYALAAQTQNATIGISAHAERVSSPACCYYTLYFYTLQLGKALIFVNDPIFFTFIWRKSMRVNLTHYLAKGVHYVNRYYYHLTLR